VGRKSWSDRRTVEQCRILSIARLVSDRLIVNGFSGSRSSVLPIRWSDGFEVIARYEQRSPGEGTLRLVYTIGGERIEDQIEVSSIPSPLGYGRRYYFKCHGIDGVHVAGELGSCTSPPVRSVSRAGPATTSLIEARRNITNGWMRFCDYHQKRYSDLCRVPTGI
jgi:hypothetical protein